MTRWQIRAVPLFCVFALAVGLKNHVIIIPLLLQTAKRDAWISALFAIPPLLLWSVAVYLILKYTHRESIYRWFKSRYNTIVAILVAIPFLLLIVSVLYITVRDVSTWTKVTYLPKTPYSVTVVLFLFASMMGALQGLRVIVISSGVLLPGVIALGFFVMSVNFQFKDYNYLWPMMTNDYRTIMHGTVYVLAGMAELILVLGLKPYVSDKIKGWAFVLVVLAITGLVFGPLLSSIVIFGPYEASDQRYPAFEQWRMVLIGKFISHLDFLSIYQWLSGALVRISLAMFLLLDMLGLTLHKLKGLWMALLGVAIFCSVTGITISDTTFLELLQNYYYPIVGTAFYVFPFVLLTLIFAKRRSEAYETN